MTSASIFRFTSPRAAAGTRSQHAVPWLFAILCGAGILVSDVSPGFLFDELVARFTRNALLVLSLILPIVAGLGLNFGIVVGAMAAQIAVVCVRTWGLAGPGGLAVAALVAAPLAALFGMAIGWVYNRSRGREMISGLIAAFLADGVYQVVLLFLVGNTIPLQDQAMILPRGYGLRSMIDLAPIQGALDEIAGLGLAIGGVRVRLPLVTLLVVAGACLALRCVLRARFGQHLRALGQDPQVAAESGIDVARHRIVATVVSTVFAAWGQLMLLQEMGTLNTYSSHQQVGLNAVAALLVSGATARRATPAQALLGVLLFHTLFVVSPLAGKALAGNAQVGVYFHIALAYGVITLALVLHAGKRASR